MATTIKSWQQKARQLLQEAGLESARQEADILLSEQLQKNPAYLFAWPEQPLTASQEKQLDLWLERRLEGVPLAWILGEWEFWGLRLKVSPATLIPRADTECLVEQALQLPLGDQARAIDLGTGTGALALALKKERPRWQVDAVDLQPAAVALARENARLLQLDVRTWQSDWWQQVPPAAYDLILSNPPYIRPLDPHLQQGDLRYEPESALVGGEDGLAAYRQLLAAIDEYLQPGGWLLVEQGYDQAEAVAELFIQAGLEQVASFKDAAGQVRMTQGRRPKAINCP